MMCTVASGKYGDQPCISSLALEPSGSPAVVDAAAAMRRMRKWEKQREREGNDSSNRANAWGEMSLVLAGGEGEATGSFGSSASLLFLWSSCSTEGWTGERWRRRSRRWCYQCPRGSRPPARGNRSCVMVAAQKESGVVAGEGERCGR